MEIGKNYKAKPFFASLASGNGSPQGGANTRTAMFGVVRECFRVEELL